MNKKLLSIAALVVVFSFGFLYLNQSLLVANDKDGKDCKKECTQNVSNKTCDKSSCDKSSCDKSACDKSSCDKSSCGDNKSGIKAGGEYSNYQFTTDKVSCEDTKAELEKSLKGVAGVKEVKFSTTCNVSKMTNVTILYSAGETSEENLASFVKDNKFDCSGNNCDKDGMKSGSNKDGECDKKNECPSMKQKKSSDSKQL